MKHRPEITQGIHQAHPGLERQLTTRKFSHKNLKIKRKKKNSGMVKAGLRERGKVKKKKIFSTTQCSLWNKELTCPAPGGSRLRATLWIVCMSGVL